MSAEPLQRLDEDSQLWIEQLRQGSRYRDEALARLRELLLRVATHEMVRRRSQLGSIAGPEFDDLVQQSANDALISILAKLEDFRGLSRFTTWACKFAIFEVSSKVARHAWQRQAPGREESLLDNFQDTLAPQPGDQLERRQQLKLLAEAIGGLSQRQRTVFVAVALNEVPMDVLAMQLGSNRNAIYKNLFDARRSLREFLAASGYPVGSDRETES